LVTIIATDYFREDYLSQILSHSISVDNYRPNSKTGGKLQLFPISVMPTEFCKAWERTLQILNTVFFSSYRNGDNLLSIEFYKGIIVPPVVTACVADTIERDIMKNINVIDTIEENSCNEVEYIPHPPENGRNERIFHRKSRSVNNSTTAID
jgi:hypothetical protein